MSTIRQLERTIANLTLAGPPQTTVSKLAALEILDSHTLAVVPFADRNSDLLRQLLANRSLGATEVRTTRSVITIRI
jgi:hypothetical protein